MSNTKNYLQHLHAFRGFAILNVVGAHAWSFMIFWTGDLSSDSLKWLFWLTETTFHGSTLYFALISGLLYSKVLGNRSWLAFYQSKLANVLMPYVIVSIAITALYWQYTLQNSAINNTFLDYLQVVAMNLITGEASIHFWYIPVLMVMFATTPVITWLQRHSKIGLWLLILAPLIISRSPFPDFVKPQSFVYFIGAYSLGIFIGAHYDKCKEWVSSYQHLLILTLALTSVALFMLYVFGYKPEGLCSMRQTLVYIQKLTVCALVLYWFSTMENSLPKWLCTLGSYAFAIFFLHVIFIGLVIESVQGIVADNRATELMALLGLGNFIAGILGSILTAFLIKRLFGKHARKIVGV